MLPDLRGAPAGVAPAWTGPALTGTDAFVPGRSQAIIALPDAPGHFRTLTNQGAVTLVRELGVPALARAAFGVSPLGAATAGGRPWEALLVLMRAELRRLPRNYRGALVVDAYLVDLATATGNMAAIGAALDDLRAYCPEARIGIEVNAADRLVPHVAAVASRLDLVVALGTPTGRLERSARRARRCHRARGQDRGAAPRAARARLGRARAVGRARRSPRRALAGHARTAHRAPGRPGAGHDRGRDRRVVTNLGVQAGLVALGGVGMFLVVFELSRRGLLSLRYALGWMGVSVLLVGAGVLLVLVGGLSESLPFTPTGLLAAVGLAFVLLITLQLSISLSGQQEAIRQLSEANALLEERVSTLEHTVEHRADENRPIDH